MYQLILSDAFQKQMRKLLKKNPQLKAKIGKTLLFLHTNLHHPSLRLHKLAGENNWSVSVAEDIRIILHWDEDALYCLRIGSHDEVY